MKLKDNGRGYSLLFLLGILIGIVCRLTDFLSYDSLWSFPSMATLFGFWIASVGIITYLSSSNKGAFINSFLYMFGMTISFYGLKYILGFYIPLFANDGKFQTDLFIIYSVLSFVCGIGSSVLYCWNRENMVCSFRHTRKHPVIQALWAGGLRPSMYALPASGMAAEAIGCLFVLINRRRLLAQTIFDIAFALIFGIGFYKKVKNKIVYLGTIIIMTGIVFYFVYKPFLLTI